MNKKQPMYPWDYICGGIAALISIIIRPSSNLVFGILCCILFGVFEVIVHSVFSKQIANYKEKLKAKEEAKKEKALALKPHEQTFYDNFTAILSTLSEEQFLNIGGYFSSALNLMPTAFPPMYAETKAILDFKKASQYSSKGNDYNFGVLKAYYDEVIQGAISVINVKKNATVEGPGFGVITSSAADTLLYGAMVEHDIKKQVQRNDYAANELLRKNVDAARKKLFINAKV